MNSERANTGSRASRTILKIDPSSTHRLGSPEGLRIVSSSSDAKLASQRSNRKECLLDDPEIGVVSINDHNVQACLCKYCTCGKHKCPGAQFSDPYPKSMFTSQYQSAYQSGSLSRPVMPPLPLPKKNLNQMDLLSIYERDFRPFRVEGDTESKPGSQANSFMYRSPPSKIAPFPKFSGVSSYHVEYPSWGGSNPYYMKRMYDGVPTREMQFDAKSLYSDSFRPLGSEDLHKSKAAVMGNLGNLSLPGPSVKIFAQTSTASAYRPIAKEFAGVRFPRKYEQVLTADIAFSNTEYKDKFSKQPSLMRNPHAIRRELEARNSQ